uniref:Serine protease-like protein n=1 Tax=Ornithodoros moubata TaxID=6938 RepID=Q6U8A8_ORNMO|nr:serine protease-like protein precursor [Ornithodoros moubata]
MAFMYMLLAALCAASATAHLTGTEQCGRPAIQPNLMVTDRIEGGVEVVPGSWPWHAELNTAGNEHLCSGALISDQYVITAAKCLWKLKSQDVKVHLGSHTRNEKDDGEVWLHIEEACVFPNYTGSHENNIAIVKLKEKVQFTDRISPICLPKKNQRLPSTVYGTGWGHSHADHVHSHDHDHDHDHSHDHDDERAPRLRQAYVDVVANDQCYNEFGEPVPNTVFCTTLRLGSPCKHDLGGPISQKDGNVWTVFGVVSGGAAGCKVGEHPMLHTRVSLYLDNFINYFVESAPGTADSKHCKLV